MKTIIEIIQEQRDFFNSNNTKEISFRIEQIKKFKQLLKENEQALNQAIYDDFGKSEFETYVTELALVYSELKHFNKNIAKWSKRKKVPSGLVNFPAKSYIIPEPLGNALVIGAWNYPYLLTLHPAISALAAGNTVILKPSELPGRTSSVLAELVNKHFPPEYFYVYEGGVSETTMLLEQKFDKIFFTGSIPVGKIVYQAAAKNLTPVTLELGGKSPTFVMADCHLKMTARRIAWAKYLNAGQTCVAPDYILVEKSIEEAFLEALSDELKNYPQTASPEAKNYMKIIDTGHFDRLEGLIDNDKVVCGGNLDRDARFISPTVLKNVSFDDAVMQDEIFGPILPVIAFSSLDKAIQKVKERPKPLSCYVYSDNKNTIDKILHEVSFGGGCVNDSVMHLSNAYLPFGGVGHSGTGSYHGKAGFDTFSHYKSILHKATWFEPNLKYAPYTAKKLKLIRMLTE